MYSIYELVDPRSNEVRYVGLTKFNLSKRLKEHVDKSKCKKRLLHVNYWINSVLDNGLFPEIRLIEKTDDNLRECYWISEYRSRGYKLTNLTDGGEFGVRGFHWTPSEDQLKLFKFKSNKHVFEFKLNGEFVIEWECISDYCREHNLGKSAITNSIKKKTACNGRVFNYINEFPEIKSKPRPKVIVTNITTDETYIFNSASKASKFLHMSDKTYFCKCVRLEKIVLGKYKLGYKL